MKSQPLMLLQLRLLVGFLGERDQCAWWPTSFYQASSKLFLEPVFSKTMRLAQYHGILEAAGRVHDENLSVGCHHLFRLPEELEQDLHAIMLSPVGEEIDRQAPMDKAAALEALKRMASEYAADATGPTAIGSIENIGSSDTLRKIAAIYLSAFTRGMKAYPYLLG